VPWICLPEASMSSTTIFAGPLFVHKGLLRETLTCE
jgi:hypothetical protein